MLFLAAIGVGMIVFQKVNWRIHLCPKVLEDKAINKKICL
jgi:hypothetical protein